MRIFGWELFKEKTKEKALTPVTSRGWFSLVKEPYQGAWQKNDPVKYETVLCYPTLYACQMRIAHDIGKLTFLLKKEDENGIWQLTKNPAYSPVLRKPNHYQTEQQFRESWQLSKLIQGNTYVLKQRDERGVVIKLYILDPYRVKPLVSETGDVFYELMYDFLSLLPQPPLTNLVVPAREIIHDREITLHHPLIGVPPLCAAYWPAVKNLRILKNSAEFFGNGATPSGILTAPGAISADTADRLKAYWDENFTGENSGRTAVVGDGLKYEQMATKAADSQLVEQLRYSDVQICQPFGIPPFKVGIGALPAGQKVDDINNLYYSDALQARIEHMENLLDEGLDIARPLGVECDLWPLLRMDQQKQATVEAELVRGAIKSPNEARLKFDLKPKTGGDAIYLQQQNFSLEALAKRDAREDPFASKGSEAAPPETEDDEDQTERALYLLYQKSPEELTRAA